MSEKKITLQKQQCPVCSRPTINADAVAEDKEKKQVALWYKCNCGVIFQKEPHEKQYKDKSFVEAHNNIKEWDLVSIRSAEIYAPLLEELTYGRKFLDVGFCTPNVMEYMKSRGWLCWGIDSNKDTLSLEYSFPKDRVLQADFETFPDFYKNSFSVVWMGFVFEEFLNPVGALHKCWELLEEDGILYISTPDIDFIQTDLHYWPHFQKDHRYILWSTRALVRELERVGFDVHLRRRNFASRFGYDRDIQIIAQKPYC